jgi:hypothetical protein
MTAATVVGCASPGTSGNAGGPQKGTLLTADEIAKFDAEGKSAYDMVARLRPRWLLPRGVQPLRGRSDSTEFALVIVNGLPMGRIQRLRDVEAFQVADIRYSDPSESGAKFGERGSSGVIEVRTKNSSRR